MGRPRAEVDKNQLLNYLMNGNPSPKEVAEKFEVSIPTITKIIAELQAEQSIILKYRDVRNLHMTKLQLKFLEAITPEKIAEAPLRDLVLGFKVFSDKENLDLGKPTELKGLLGVLVKAEKEEFAGEETLEVINTNFDKEEDISNAPEQMPDL